MWAPNHSNHEKLNLVKYVKKSKFQEVGLSLGPSGRHSFTAFWELLN